MTFWYDSCIFIFTEKFGRGGYMSKKIAFLTLVLVIATLFAVCLSASAEYKDNFSDPDYSSNGWYTRVLLGNPDKDYIYPELRRLSIRLPKYDTALYVLNDSTYGENQTVEATFENIFSMNTQFGIICRYQEYGWYEFRIKVAGENAGSYTVYKYDQYLKSQGKSPYVNLHPGMDRYMSTDIKCGLNAKNTLKMICDGSEIRVFINGNEQFPIRNGSLIDSDFEDGDTGFMVWNEMPGEQAQVDITKFSAQFDE